MLLVLLVLLRMTRRCTTKGLLQARTLKRRNWTMRAMTTMRTTKREESMTTRSMKPWPNPMLLLLLLLPMPMMRLGRLLQPPSFRPRRRRRRPPRSHHPPPPRRSWQASQPPPPPLPAARRRGQRRPGGCCSRRPRTSRPRRARRSPGPSHRTEPRATAGSKGAMDAPRERRDVRQLLRLEQRQPPPPRSASAGVRSARLTRWAHEKVAPAPSRTAWPASRRTGGAPGRQGAQVRAGGRRTAGRSTRACRAAVSCLD
mmetsp:Transcript_2480/g.4735  ORF Transcript_2480/g.4735 Transcript_2480/m.4735 type:complete len:257 (-) Transcript_2480:755-1525(-)